MNNKPLPNPPKNRLIDNAPLMVMGLLLVDSLHFVFARLLLPHLPPLTSALYVLGIGTLQIAIFAHTRGPIRFDVFRQHPWFFLVIGLLVASSTALNYASVQFIDPGTASMLGKSSVLFGLGFSLLWLRDRFTPLQFMGAALAIVGIIIISFQPGDYLRLGSFMIVFGSFMYAFHAAIVKRYGSKIALVDFFLFRLICTTSFLFVFAIIDQKLIWPSGQAWLLLLLVGTVDVVISRGLYYVALRRFKLSIHAIVLTLSPVVAIGWSLLLFGTTPNPQQLLGGVAVLVGVFLVTIRAGK